MSLLGVTTAVILIASSGTTSLGTESSDAVRIASNGGFLLGNAHRCGIATDRVVKAGQLIRQLIEAAAKDDKEQQDATEQFASFFLLTAMPERDEGKAADRKLVASCNTVTSEFQKFERHKINGAAGKMIGNTPGPGFRLGDGE